VVTPGPVLGYTYEVAGLVKAPISFDGAGVTGEDDRRKLWTRKR
jgi:hypothetical protein